MLLAPVVGILVVFLVYPLGYVFREAFFPDGRFSLGFFSAAFANPLLRESVLNSLVLGLVVTALTAVVAVPLGVAIAKYRFPGKGLWMALLLLPMIMPPFVGAIGMRQLLARFGSVNLLLLRCGLISSPIDWLGGAQFWGVVILEVLHLYPIMYLNVVAAAANVDPSLEEAAATLGSSGLKRLWRVTLPLMTPGLFAGGIIVFIWAFTDLGTPLIFEYTRVVPVQIFYRVTEISGGSEAYALVVIVLVMTLVMFLVSKRFFGLRSYASLSRGGVAGQEKTPGTLGKTLLIGMILLVVGCACVPHAAVVLTSIRDKWFMTALPQSYTLSHYGEALGHELTLSSIRNSIAYSAMSTVVDIVLGVLIAYILVRQRFRGADILDALVMLPLAVPGIVLAFGYVGSFAGTALNPRENPVVLLVMAYAIRRLPYMVRAAHAGFEQVSVSLEEVAINLGSPPLRALRRITVPLIGANLIGGGILCFAFAMLEVSDSLILALKEKFFPITKAIYMLVSRIEDGSYIASALGVWAMVFLALSLVSAAMLLGRRMGQLFRV